MADSPRIEELKRRVQSDPASIAFAALAEEYRRAGRFDEAIDTCTSGLIRHPAYLSAHVTLGRALMDVGRLDDARRELESVLKIAPENLAAIRGLAEIHDRLREEGHAQAAVSAPEEPSASADAEMVAEIHAASGFSPPPEEEPLQTIVAQGASSAEVAVPDQTLPADPIPDPLPALALPTVHPADPPAPEFVRPPEQQPAPESPADPREWEFVPPAAEPPVWDFVGPPAEHQPAQEFVPPPAEPPAWEFVAPPVEPAASESVSPQDDPEPVATPAIMIAAPEDPALAGLEAFLHAIQRARSERALPR
jgi:hypothetical protein